jgi:uncharacterized protein
MNEQFFGRGLAFPLQPGTSGLAESTGAAKVEESILLILGTEYGERVMRPRFGCKLGSLIFSPNNASTANLAKFYVTDALAQWESRIDVIDVDVANDNIGGALLINITYRLRATQDIRNLIYPFYLERRS